MPGDIINAACIHVGATINPKLLKEHGWPNHILKVTMTQPMVLKLGGSYQSAFRCWVRIVPDEVYLNEVASLGVL